MSEKENDRFQRRDVCREVHRKVDADICELKKSLQNVNAKITATLAGTILLLVTLLIEIALRVTY